MIIVIVVGVAAEGLAIIFKAGSGASRCFALRVGCLLKQAARTVDLPIARVAVRVLDTNAATVEVLLN
jgi:hypothetical protein